MAFIDNKMAELRNQFIYAFTGAVDDGHRHRFDPALAVADESRLAPEKLTDPVLPLMEKLFCVHDDQCGLPAAGDKVQGHDRLAAAGACLKHPEGTVCDQIDSCLLIRPQASGKGQFNLRQHTSQINDLGGCSRMLAAQQDGLVRKSSRKTNALGDLLKIIESGLQPFADPASIPFRRHIQGIIDGQLILYGCDQSGWRSGKKAIRGNCESRHILLSAIGPGRGCSEKISNFSKGWLEISFCFSPTSQDTVKMCPE